MVLFTIITISSFTIYTIYVCFAHSNMAFYQRILEDILVFKETLLRMIYGPSNY